MKTLEEVTTIVEEAMLAPGGQLPMLVIEGNGEPVVKRLKKMPAAYEERLQAMFATGAHLAKSGEVAVLRQVFLAVKGWMSYVPEDQPEMPPSLLHTLDREGVLIISGGTVKKPSIIVCNMVHDEDEKLVALERLRPVRKTRLRMINPLVFAFLEGFRLEKQGKLN